MQGLLYRLNLGLDLGTGMCFKHFPKQNFDGCFVKNKYDLSGLAGAFCYPPLQQFFFFQAAAETIFRDFAPINFIATSQPRPVHAAFVFEKETALSHQKQTVTVLTNVCVLISAVSSAWHIWITGCSKS